MTELAQPLKTSLTQKHHRKRSFVHEHSLSIASICILLLWIGSYISSNPSTHLGSFFGNAIADWSGVVVTVLATKYYMKKVPLLYGPPEVKPSATKARADRSWFARKPASYQSFRATAYPVRRPWKNAWRTFWLESL